MKIIWKFRVSTLDIHYINKQINIDEMKYQ